MATPLDAARAAVWSHRAQTLTALVQREIERMILAGELRSGERINENALAARLSVSRGPIREACRGLEQAGLLTAVANRGVFVREVSLEEALDAYDIRAALFGLAGQALAARITTDELQRLRALAARMAEVAGRDDVDAYYPLNLEFHAAIVDFSGNRQLAAIYQGLVKQLHLFRRRGLVQGLPASSREHGEILSGLEARDGPAARRLMERHVLGGKARLLAAIARGRGDTPERREDL